MIRWLLALPFRILYGLLRLFVAPKIQRSLNADDAASLVSGPSRKAQTCSQGLVFKEFGTGPWDNTYTALQYFICTGCQEGNNRLTGHSGTFDRIGQE